MNNQEIEAQKLKLLAEFYSRLEDIEEGFERLEKETGKLMLAENANENFDAYYKFVNPIIRKVENVKIRAMLARKALKNYREIDNPQPLSLFSPKFSTEQPKPIKQAPRSTNVKTTNAFEQLEKRVDDLEFRFRLIFLSFIAIIVLFFLKF